MSPGIFGPKEPRTQPSLLQIVDALIMYDDPVLDRRFQEALAMHPDAHVRAKLATLPEKVAEGSRITRRAGVEWERVTGSSVLDETFQVRAERHLLQGLLDGAEAQIRLKVFMASHAPTQAVRGLIDDAIGIHRDLAHGLREAIARLEPLAKEQHGVEEGVSYAGARPDSGDLRGQIEAAIRDMSARGRRARMLVLSSNAMRHLRDQGVLRDQPTLLGVPVQIDMSWPGSTFALLSNDSPPLEEILAGASGA